MTRSKIVAIAFSTAPRGTTDFSFDFPSRNDVDTGIGSSISCWRILHRLESRLRTAFCSSLADRRSTNGTRTCQPLGAGSRSTISPSGVEQGSSGSEPQVASASTRVKQRAGLQQPAIPHIPNWQMTRSNEASGNAATRHPSLAPFNPGRSWCDGEHGRLSSSRRATAPWPAHRRRASDCDSLHPQPIALDTEKYTRLLRMRFHYRQDLVASVPPAGDRGIPNPGSCLSHARSLRLLPSQAARSAPGDRRSAGRSSRS